MPFSLLIVDDSFIARSMIKQRLPQGEYKVREADSGPKAIELFKLDKPDLVLLDLTMPGMTGFDVLVEMKKLDANAQVVVISADVQEQARQRVLQSGARAMLTKPPQPETLKEIIDQMKS